MEILIEKDVNLEEIEKYYGQLSRFAEVDGKVDLKVPIALINNYMGLVPAICQFVITWIRYPFAGKLMLNILDPEKEDFSMLFENEHLFPIVVLAWSKKGIFNSNGEIDLRHYIKDVISKIRNSMLKARALKGNKLLLVSIDHFPATSGLIPAYENEDGFIDNEKNTYRNLKSGLGEILVYSQEARNAYAAYEEDFIGIIHELIKNTYEWGRTNRNNVPVDPGIRGIVVKFYKKRRSTLADEYKLHKGLFEYFSSSILKENDNKELYFLEISVFDSGIGFVDKYESPDKGELSDIQIIKRCLIKHMTSAKGLEKDDKGIGLDRILSLLNNKGFLRIKTHQSTLYRNLISHPYKTVSNEKDIELFDWKSKSNKTYTSYFKTAGSVLTILYPLSLNLPK